jgi:anti-anti-sigma factor
VTFFSVLFLDLELAIFAGVILSLVFYLNRASHPNVAVLAPQNVDNRRRFTDAPNQPECPQLKIVRIEGAIYFGAVASVIEDLHRLESRFPDQRHMLVLASNIHFIDITGAEAIANEAKVLRAAGGALYLVDMKESVEAQFRKTGLIKMIGEENVFHSKTAAFAAIYARLDRSVCARCTERIFWECRVDDSNPAPEPEPLHPAMPPLRVVQPALPEPAPAPEAPVAAKPKANPKRKLNRILVLVDINHNPRETVAMGARLAQRYEAEIALGNMVSWDVSRRGGLALNLVSESLVASLRPPARARLQGLAAEAGYPDCQTLIATKQDPWEATLEMVTDWHPDLLVVADRGVFDPGFRRQVTYRTPSGITEVRLRRYRPVRNKKGD